MFNPNSVRARARQLESSRYHDVETSSRPVRYENPVLLSLSFATRGKVNRSFNRRPEVSGKIGDFCPPGRRNWSLIHQETNGDSFICNRLHKAGG